MYDLITVITKYNSCRYFDGDDYCFVSVNRSRRRIFASPCTLHLQNLQIQIQNPEVFKIHKYFIFWNTKETYSL